MNHARLAILLAGVLAVGVGLGYWFSGKRAESSPGAPAAAAADGRRILYWHDPMVPGQRFDRPGKSPFMDMQLVPVYADDAPTDASVHVGANVVQNLGMRFGKVERSAFVPRFTAVGSVAFDERRVHVIQARTEGYVQRLLVKSPLASVRRGQPLVELVSPQWISAQQEYLALLDAGSEQGKAVRDAARLRLQVLGVPDSAVRELEQTRTSRASTMLASPVDGIVSELSVRQGAAVATGAPLFRIAGLETVWVNAQVPEAQVASIPKGAAVTVHATAWPRVDFSGRVLEILPDVEAQSRTLPVRIEVQNHERKLAPGMFVSIELEASAGEPQLVVPSEAVIMTGERSVVVVSRGKDGFDVVPVEVGPEAGGRTVILSGLIEGQGIVLSGQFLIDSEASLGSAVSRLSSGAARAGASAHPTEETITPSDGATTPSDGATKPGTHVEPHP